MDEVATRLSQRLKNEREARGWSLAKLSSRAGVSRAMISKIERCEVSATATLLAKIGQAFDMSLPALFAPSEMPLSPLTRLAEQTVWRDPASLYERRAVAVSTANRPLDIVAVDFPAFAHVLFDSQNEGTIAQYVWLLEGRMRISLAADVHDLAQGDCLFMRLNTPLAFHNPGPSPARYAVILWRTPAS